MTWRRDPGVLWRRTPAHVVAVRPPATEPTILSGSARDLWDLLAAPVDVDTLGRQLAADPVPLLGELAAVGLARDDPVAPTPAEPRRPEVEPPAAPSDPGSPSGDVLVDALTFWLPGAPDPISSEPLSEDQWETLMAEARRQRCFGPLCWAVGSGALPSTSAQREEAERYAILGARHALQQERELLDVHACLRGAGIETRVLKGLAVAHLDHLDPSFRASADLDLLVRPESLDDAVAVLSDAGYERELPERRSGFDARYGKDVTLQAPDRYEIDLHRLPLAGPLGLSMDLDVLWLHLDSFRIGGTVMEALCAEARFAHAAWSLSLTDPAPRLVPALDMAAIAEHCALDREVLDSLIPTGSGRYALDDAITVAKSQLGPRTAPRFPPVSGHAPTRAERALVHTYPGYGGSKSAYLLAGAISIESWCDRARYVAQLLVPSRAYRRARRAQDRAPEWRLAFQATRERRRRNVRSRS